MRQARIAKASEPLVIEEIEIPNAPPDGLVIKTSFSGICHSDYHQWQDMIDLGGTNLKFTNFPGYKGVAGHEISGTVHSLGQQLTSDDGLEMGDRVVVYPWIGCQQCSYCLQSSSNLCEHRLYIGLLIAGGFAEYVLVPHKRYVVKVPDTVPMHLACMLPCSGLTAYNAMSKVKPQIEMVTKFEGKASLLITGAGALGLWCLQICRASLPKTTKIVVADIGDEKLQIARDLGCDDTVKWAGHADELELIKNTKSTSLNKEGFTAIVDFVNNASTFARNFECLRKNGNLVMVGLFGGGSQLSLPRVVMDSKQINGVFTGSISQLKKMLNMLSSHEIVPPPIEYFKLEEITDAFRLMEKGKLKGRGIVQFDQQPASECANKSTL